MIRSNEKEVKEINLKLGELRDALTEIKLMEMRRFEDLSDSEWESYRVQEELAPCSDVEEAIIEIEMAMHSLRCALEG